MASPLSTTEILKVCRSKWIHFLGSCRLLSVYTRPLAGLCISYKLVSDLLKLDILVTKASPHFPRLKGGSLSLPGTQPSVFQGLQLYHPLYTRRQMSTILTCLYGWDSEMGQNRQFSPTLSLCSSAVTPLCFCSKLSLAATVRGRQDIELEA